MLTNVVNNEPYCKVLPKILLSELALAQFLLTTSSAQCS